MVTFYNFFISLLILIFFFLNTFIAFLKHSLPVGTPQYKVICKKSSFNSYNLQLLFNAPSICNWNSSHLFVAAKIHSVLKLLCLSVRCFVFHTLFQQLIVIKFWKSSLNKFLSLIDWFTYFTPSTFFFYTLL